MKRLKKLFTLRFFLVLVVSFLAFEGIEHLLHDLFDLDLKRSLTFPGLGFVIFFGLKFHILCCAIPTLISVIYCTHKHDDHCDHNHEVHHE